MLPDRAPTHDPDLVSAAGLAEVRRLDGSQDGPAWQDADIRGLVLELARDNPGWGYTKIRDALRGLKIEIGRTTVASILADAGVEPAPERNRKRTWAHFLKSHWETLDACDFFGVEVLGAFGTVRYMVFFVMDRYDQGIGSRIIRPKPSPANDNAMSARIGRRSRLGGLLNYYFREAA